MDQCRNEINRLDLSPVSRALPGLSQQALRHLPDFILLDEYTDEPPPLIATLLGPRMGRSFTNPIRQYFSPSTGEVLAIQTGSLPDATYLPDHPKFIGASSLRHRAEYTDGRTEESIHFMHLDDLMMDKDRALILYCKISDAMSAYLPSGYSNEIQTVQTLIDDSLESMRKIQGIYGRQIKPRIRNVVKIISEVSPYARSLPNVIIDLKQRYPPYIPKQICYYLPRHMLMSTPDKRTRFKRSIELVGDIPEWVWTSVAEDLVYRLTEHIPEKYVY